MRVDDWMIDWSQSFASVKLCGINVNVKEIIFKICKCKHNYSPLASYISSLASYQFVLEFSQVLRTKAYQRQVEIVLIKGMVGCQ